MNSAKDIAVVGRACRLPGAPSVDDLWTLLACGRCAVSRVPADRWSLERFAHPRVGERGRSYTWAAGCLDDIWGFDPGAFGISPREAEMMDPQQRLLLELTWEALEDAGIAPSRLAGTDTGVFVGVSSVDSSNLRMLDMAGSDAYMMTGNTLSIIANRISHIFDLRGPSLIVDTACSSSLVALSQALGHLRSGRIETAIVAGVSILATPHAFIGFAQAAMLSPRGLCQAFSAAADGYVRAEGGVVLVLQTRDAAARDGNAVHAFVAAADVNSDGRTTGISLPSEASQARLLSSLYSEAAVDPDDLVFFEAHGTGTPVGDPIEAAAIGTAIGRSRRTPLPIGSLKTNVGHTEAASGLSGVLKAMLALEHDALPPSLHADALNPAIDFAALNLTVARSTMALPRIAGRRRFAGVNSFGFGGTNAHVILADGPLAPLPGVDASPQFLLVSAHSRNALRALCATYAKRLAAVDEAEANAIMSAAAYRRDRLPHRAVLAVTDRAQVAAVLERLAAPEQDGIDRGTADAVCGVAVERAAPVAFVFSGNGSQFVGMGLAAYRRNAAFRARLDEVSTRFEALAGWSIVAALHADDLGARLARTSVAQPLLFAIQVAATHALRARGLAPAFVLGHSVGEVAAALAAGILDEAGALATIHARSRHQELTFGHGGMAVVFGARRAVEHILADLPGLTVAACNSPRCVTLSGSAADIARLPAVARRHQARSRRLDLAYPFHCALMAPVEMPLRRSLAGLAHANGDVRFISTVTGAEQDGASFSLDYWWRNVREPVRFCDAITTAVANGARAFVEIGPAPALLAHIQDSVDARAATVATLCVLDKSDAQEDPIAQAVATALARGAAVDDGRAFGPPPARGSRVALPSYPWQRTTHRLAETTESISDIRPSPWHPLIGARLGAEQLEWRSNLDTLLNPSLADHCVNGRAILPGAAFLEMMLAVSRDWLGAAAATITDFEISTPLPVSEIGRSVLCRLSPLISHVEILSRPRLSQGPWQSHASAKIVKDSTAGSLPALPVDDHVRPLRQMTGAEIYARAEAAGLRYGPSYRKLVAACVVSADVITFELSAEPADPAFGLDPARLDACFHALATASGEHGDAPIAYIPVRVAQVSLRHPGQTVRKGRIDILRRDHRAILADLTLESGDGEIVALIRHIRFQAIRPSRTDPAAPSFILTRFLLAREPTCARGNRQLLLADYRRGRTVSTPQRSTDRFVLLEGWATSLALHFARELADAGVLVRDEILAAGRLPFRARAWLNDLLVSLERSGLARQDGPVCLIDLETVLPDPDDILRTLAREHPELPAELLIAAGATRTMSAAGIGEAGDRARPLSEKVTDHFELGSATARAAAAYLLDRLKTAAKRWPTDRALRILQIGSGPLSRGLVRLAHERQAFLTLLEPNRRRLERARLTFADRGDIDFVETTNELRESGFDLVVAANASPQCWRLPGFWGGLRRAMAPAAIFVAVEPLPSFFRTVVLGLAACAAEPGAESDGRSMNETDWRGALAAAGLDALEVAHVDTVDGTALRLTAQVAGVRRTCIGKGRVLIVADGEAEAASALATRLASSGCHVSVLLDDARDNAHSAEQPDSVVVFASEGPGTRRRPSAERLGRLCMRLSDIAGMFRQRHAKLWLVTSGALAADPGGSPVASGLWAFARTLANEMPDFDIRRVDVARDLGPDHVADRLHELVTSDTSETDIRLDASATRVVRFEPQADFLPARRPPAEAARLSRGDGAGLNRLSWRATVRRAPQAGEVEIEVAATGVNFRDVMLALGLLPDEILEDGFAGPTLGLECAGRIVRVGQRVNGFKVGDRVMAFAREAFATHVTVAAPLVAAMGNDISFDAAATIPVAFLTAHYALMRCARLKPGEWVLIHGGAGAVGLAALQIAHVCRARVVATAGSPERRALLTALGAEYAFDSRSGSFVEDVRAITGEGVAVVLNSVSDEAMERSIGLLRPFGRFVELGKRDYAANSHIGLRPFRRNLSYFGVDLDQVLLHRPAESRRSMRAVMRLFARGDLVPLPFKSFDADETVDAFRVMQQSAHVGKLVVRPPGYGEVHTEIRGGFRISSDKAHLVTGGFGGFGIETARWLADQGARHIVLLGRSGPTSDQARNLLAELAGRGVAVWHDLLDIMDRLALERLFARFGRDLPPLGGVIHAAMVLADSAVSNITAEMMDAVLRPKVEGADNLDQLTRDRDLDYFVLYSSATTLVGNPGQAAYVAANGYLEGLARRRRAVGLPALAIAWGAIADVGVLARTEETRAALSSRFGIGSMTARAALDAMGRALSIQASSPYDAVVAIAPLAGAPPDPRFPLLRSPSYRKLLGQATRNDGGAVADAVDLSRSIVGMSAGAARDILADVILDEVCRVLRWPRTDVTHTARLAELGVDSLMGVELAYALEMRLGLPPLAIAVSALSVNALAEHILDVVRGTCRDEEQDLDGLLDRHPRPVSTQEVRTDAHPAEVAATHLSERDKRLSLRIHSLGA